MQTQIAALHREAWESADLAGSLLKELNQQMKNPDLETDRLTDLVQYHLLVILPRPLVVHQPSDLSLV